MLYRADYVEVVDTKVASYVFGKEFPRRDFCFFVPAASLHKQLQSQRRVCVSFLCSSSHSDKVNTEIKNVRESNSQGNALTKEELTNQWAAVIRCIAPLPIMLLTTC